MTANESRNAILARIRGSIQQSRGTHLIPTTPIERQYRQAGSLSPEERLALFTERLREYDARVTRVDPSLLSEAIAHVITESGAQAQTEQRPGWVVADGFPAGWLRDPDSLRWAAQASTEDLDRCTGIITTCSVGIAITGTIVLQHGPGEGRRLTSLLPDRHLCVIQSSQVVETVPEAFQRLAATATRPITFISGPSATADIEMTRIRGVHGPRQLDVILVHA